MSAAVVAVEGKPTAYRRGQRKAITGVPARIRRWLRQHRPDVRLIASWWHVRGETLHYRLRIEWQNGHRFTLPMAADLGHERGAGYGVSDAVKSVWSYLRRADPECDCGRPKKLLAEACRRCLWLDGETVGLAELVHALRIIDEPATNVDIAGILGVKANSVQMTIDRHRESGRFIVLNEDGGGHVPQRYALAGWERYRRAG